MRIVPVDAIIYVTYLDIANNMESFGKH